MICITGILLALLERQRNPSRTHGQIVDVSMVDGLQYVASYVFSVFQTPLWDRPRGLNMLDSGAHFYNLYETKDGLYISVYGLNR